MSLDIYHTFIGLLKTEHIIHLPLLKNALKPEKVSKESEWNLINILLRDDVISFGFLGPQYFPILFEVIEPPSRIST